MIKWHKFYHSLLNSPSNEVSVIARLASRDIRTTIGANLQYLRQETQLDPSLYGSNRIKEELLQYHRPTIVMQDWWRVDYLEKLLTARMQAYYDGNTDQYDQLNTLIHSLVIN